MRKLKKWTIVWTLMGLPLTLVGQPQAPTFEWAHRLKSESAYTWGLKVDPLGNPVFVGWAGSEIEMGNTNLPVAEPNFTAGVVISSDGEGNGVDGISITGSGSVEATDISFGESAFFVVGTILGGTDLDFGGTLLSSTNGQTGFVASYDLERNLNWVVQISDDGATHNLVVQAVTALESGDVVIGGRTQHHHITVSDTTYTGNGGSAQFFLARLSPNGTILWARVWGGYNIEYISDIAITPDEGIIAVGDFSGDEMDLGNITLPNAYAGDGFVIRLDKAGNPTWARSINTSTNAWDLILAVAIDTRTERIILAGTSDLTGDRAVLVQALNLQGDTIWATTSQEDAPEGHALDVDIDSSSNVFVGGQSVVGATLWKFDTEGNLIWKKSPPSIPPGLLGSSGAFAGVRVTDSDQIFLAGDIYQSHFAFDFDGSLIEGPTGNSYSTAFIAKLGPEFPFITHAVGPDSIKLSWPTNQSGFVLERNTLDLSPSGWTTVPTGVDGGQNTATNSLEGPGSVYRLRKP